MSQKLTLDELTEIVKLADLRKIKKALKAAGFFDCKWNKQLCHVPLVTICQGQKERTPYFPDGKGNEYIGDLSYDVKGYEQYQFALVQLLSPLLPGDDMIFTEDILIFAKDITDSRETAENRQ